MNSTDFEAPSECDIAKLLASSDICEYAYY